MNARRIYATEDPNMRVTFRVGDTWMGSHVKPAQGVVFTIRVEDDEPIQLVELITNSGKLVEKLTPPPQSNTVVWEPVVPVTPGKWYYVKVTATDVLDSDPPVQMAVTAPIWID